MIIIWKMDASGKTLLFSDNDTNTLYHSFVYRKNIYVYKRKVRREDKNYNPRLIFYLRLEREWKRRTTAHFCELRIAKKHFPAKKIYVEWNKWNPQWNVSCWQTILPGSCGCYCCWHECKKETFSFLSLAVHFKYMCLVTSKKITWNQVIIGREYFVFSKQCFIFRIFVHFDFYPAMFFKAYHKAIFHSQCITEIKKFEMSVRDFPFISPASPYTVCTTIFLQLAENVFWSTVQGKMWTVQHEKVIVLHMQWHNIYIIDVYFFLSSLMTHCTKLVITRLVTTRWLVKWLWSCLH